MLILYEGTDKSGKSTLLQLVMQALRYQGMPCLTIRKQYNADLYPIDFGKASMYDWQAILDRVVLANPDVLFLADRSFLTQAAWQTALGEDEHAMTDEQRHMLDMYCKVCNDINALTVYCKSDRFELDTIVDSINKRQLILDAYDSWLSKLDNVLILDTDNLTIYDCFKLVLDKVNELIRDKYITSN